MNYSFANLLIKSLDLEMEDNQASLIWGFPILPILSSYGGKKIKYGISLKIHEK